MPRVVTITFDPKTHKATAHPDPARVHKTLDPPNDKFDCIKFNGSEDFLIRFEEPEHFPGTPNPLPGGPGKHAETKPVGQDVPVNLKPEGEPEEKQEEKPYKYTVVHVASKVETDPGYRVGP